MQPKAWRKIALMSLLIAGGRAADEFTSFLVDPTLYSEGNLFLRHVWFRAGLPWSWAMIAYLEAFFVLLLAFGLWYYLRNYRSFFPKQPGYSAKQFTAYCWRTLQLSGSQHLKRMVILAVFVLWAVAIPISYWAAASNLYLLVFIEPLIVANPYNPITNVFDAVQSVLMVLVPAVSVVLAMFFLHRGWYREYNLLNADSTGSD